MNFRIINEFGSGDSGRGNTRHMWGNEIGASDGRLYAWNNDVGSSWQIADIEGDSFSEIPFTEEMKDQIS